jgi:rare lipoprotein A
MTVTFIEDKPRNHGEKELPMRRLPLNSFVYFALVLALGGSIGSSAPAAADISRKAPADVVGPADNAVATETVVLGPNTILAEAAPVYQQVGVASWYGGRHQGRLTASGEVFDENKLTAAHLTLPLDTKARVTNLTNGRSVEVMVNDRGPYVHGRVIDLSTRAAHELGMAQRGLALVRIEVVQDTVDDRMIGAGL